MVETVLVTGASGAVGREVLKELLKRSDRYRTRVFSLPSKGEQRFFQPYQGQAELVWGDLRDPVAVQQAVAGVDAVIHVAALIPPFADQQPELARAVNIGGTHNLIAALQTQADPVRFIYSSSISVYGDRVDEPLIRVGDPLRPSVGDAYALTKIEAENLLRASGLPATILRLCGVLTPSLKLQPLMFHMPLETRLEWIHSADAGLALVKALENRAVLGRTFNLGGGESCRRTAREFLHEMLPIFGIHPAALPEWAFATLNFHSGYYADGDELHSLLDFRRGSLPDYYAAMRARVTEFRRRLTALVPRPLLQFYFERMSEPLQAIRTNNQALIHRYYGSRQAFEQLVRQTRPRAFA